MMKMKLEAFPEMFSRKVKALLRKERRRIGAKEENL